VDYALPRNRLVGILERHGIRYVDMVDRMLESHTSEDPCIFADGHINVKGHRVFADALMDELGDGELAA